MAAPEKQFYENLNSIKTGFYVSIATSIVTLITFAIAISTPPLSGPFCIENCYNYPYHDIIERFPRDYFWMYPAILISILFIAMIASIHHHVNNERKLFSLMSLSFSIISSTILTLDYFIQLSVIQSSLLAGETESIAILSQFNSHGIFIVMEEIGFIFMSISFACLIPVFSGKTRIESIIRMIFIVGFLLTLLSFILITFHFGHKREYRFEIVVISITWLQLLISGILFGIFYRRIFE